MSKRFKTIFKIEKSCHLKLMCIFFSCGCLLSKYAVKLYLRHDILIAFNARDLILWVDIYKTSYHIWPLKSENIYGNVSIIFCKKIAIKPSLKLMIARLLWPRVIVKISVTWIEDVLLAFWQHNHTTVMIFYLFMV